MFGVRKRAISATINDEAKQLTTMVPITVGEE
jgi:hypothetical protein